MKDITGAKYVQVAIRDDKKVLWINTEEGCVLRICQIERFEPLIDVPAELQPEETDSVVTVEDEIEAYERTVDGDRIREQRSKEVIDGTTDVDQARDSNDAGAS